MLLFSAIGAALNVIRGGGLHWFKYGKALNILAFGTLAALYMQPHAPLALAEWLRLPLDYGAAQCAQFVLACVCMWAGQAPSWGEIVGQDGILGGNRKAHLSAALRGAYWGSLLCIPAWSFLPLFAGLTLGLCFEIGRFVELKYGKNGWRVGEALLGAGLWSACFV